MINLASHDERSELIKQIYIEENKYRKALAFRDFEIFSDRIHQYVYEYLRGFLSTESLRDMPIISTLNLCRRIVKQEASIYRSEPKRTFFNVSQEQEAALKRIYSMMRVNTNLRVANEYYKLHQQASVQVYVKGGKIVMRPLMVHLFDVVPRDDDPTQANAYIVSGLDRRFINQAQVSNQLDSSTGARGNSLSNYALYSNLQNEKIADKEDYLKTLGKFEVWSDDFNFIMDMDGNVISQDEINPINSMPFIDIKSKSDEAVFFVRRAQNLPDFTIQYNAAYSDLYNLVRLQGYSQAIISGPPDLMPQNLQVGPNRILKLPKIIDPQTGQETSKLEFAFVSPNSDIGSSLTFLESLLANYLTSRGLDPKTISGKQDGNRFSSGVERLLSEISKFEASSEDIDLFRDVENQTFDLIRKWHNAMQSELDPRYRTQTISEDAFVEVEYRRPEMLMSTEERESSIQRRRELGLMSRVQAVKELYNLDQEAAINLIAEIDGEDTRS